MSKTTKAIKRVFDSGFLETSMTFYRAVGTRFIYSGWFGTNPVEATLRYEFIDHTDLQRDETMAWIF